MQIDNAASKFGNATYDDTLSLMAKIANTPAEIKLKNTHTSHFSFIGRPFALSLMTCTPHDFSMQVIFHEIICGVVSGLWLKGVA